MRFNKCPICGANLDPGEVCDCVVREEPKRDAISERKEEMNGNYPRQSYYKKT